MITSVCEAAREQIASTSRIEKGIEKISAPWRCILLPPPATAADGDEEEGALETRG